VLDWVLVQLPHSPADSRHEATRGQHRRHRHRRRKTLGRLATSSAVVVFAVCGLALIGVSLAGALTDQAEGAPATGTHSGGLTGQPGVAALPRGTAMPPGASGRPGRAATARHAAPLRTSCRSVAHIGDSTSVGLVSSLYLPDLAERLAAQYARVGVQKALISASGGRSIVETLPGQVNGYNVALGWAGRGYRGCWVIALGTNDTANVSIGSPVTRMDRIEEMMSVARGEPVLWVNVWSLLGSGPWSQANMRLWNATLLQACARYPNMRIFDWAGVVRPSWFISDGIHYTSQGYAARARAIASALARAFPYNAESHGCVIG